MWIQFALLVVLLFVTPVEAPPVPQCIVRSDSFLGAKTACGGGLQPMSELASQQVSSEESFGAKNIADLILSRGGIFDYEKQNLQRMHICALHRDEMGAGWTTVPANRPKKKAPQKVAERCNMPTIESFVDHPTPVFAEPYKYMAKEQAIAVMKQKNVMVPLGTAMCRNHKTFVDGLAIANNAASDAQDELAQPSTSGTAAKRPRTEYSYIESPITLAAWKGAGQDVCKIQPGVPNQQTPGRRDPSFEPGSSGSSSIDVDTPPIGRNDACKNVQQGIRFIATALGMPQTSINFGKWKGFGHITADYRSKKVNAAYKITDAVMSAIAPDAPSYLMSLVMKKKRRAFGEAKRSQAFHEWIEQIGELIALAPSREARLFTLATVTPIMEYSELETFLPGLTRYMYKEARKYAKIMRSGIQIPPHSHHRERYNKEKVETFIGFITSPMVVSDLPFGGHTVKYESGMTEEIPNLIRTTVNKRIIDQYNHWLRDTHRAHLNMSDSTLWRILKQCKAVTRKSLLGLDYYTYEGVEGVANLIELVESLKANVDWTNQTKRTLRHVKLFLKTDYKTYIQHDSDISDYSRVYALSDPNDPNLQATIPNLQRPRRRCAMCIAMMKAFKEIKEQIESKATWDEENGKLEAEFVLEKSSTAILEWQKHVMRTVNQLQGKDEILQNLQDNEVWVIMDWAMKFIPRKGIESQTEWYGKRGINWHISVAYVKSSNEQKYYMRSFVHIFDPVAQDSETVLAILRDVLGRIKSELRGITKAYLRSDNAGCYHSSMTLAAVHKLEEKTGIKVVRYDFSDPQSGKGPCDRATSVIKRHVKIYVDENHKCTTAGEFLVCAGSPPGVKSTTFVHTGLEAPAGRQGKGTIPLITSLHNFEFSSEGAAPKIRAWNAYKIGTGKILRFTPREAELPKLTVRNISTAGLHEGDHYFFDHMKHWIPLSEASMPQHAREQPPPPVTADDGWVPDESDDDPEVEPTAAVNSDDPDVLEGLHHKPIFQCEEEGCTKSFQLYPNYFKHVSIGKHTYRRERLSLHDFSIKTYAAKIRENQVFSHLPGGTEAIESQRDEEADSEDVEPLVMGWGQKHRKPTVRFTAKQKAFLFEKFMHGAAQKNQKYNPHEVAKQMRRHKDFKTKDLWLTWTQISCYWTKLAKQQEQGADLAQLFAAAKAAAEGAPAGAAQDDDEELELEDIVDSEYANDYARHIEEVIDEVIGQSMQRD